LAYLSFFKESPGAFSRIDDGQLCVPSCIKALPGSALMLDFFLVPQGDPCCLQQIPTLLSTWPPSSIPHPGPPNLQNMPVLRCSKGQFFRRSVPFSFLGSRYGPSGLTCFPDRFDTFPKRSPGGKRRGDAGTAIPAMLELLGRRTFSDEARSIFFFSRFLFFEFF